MQMRLIDEAWRLSHVDYFREIVVKEGIGDVKLFNFQAVVNGDGNEHTNGSQSGDRIECLVVVDAILLVEALGYDTSLVVDEGTVGAKLYLEDPSATENVARDQAID